MSLAAAVGDESGVVWLTNEELAVASPEERRAYAAYLRRELHKRDPVAWGQEVLHEEWWSKQREIARSVANNRRTAVRSCHDSGKSFIAARIACWWLATGTPGKRFVVSTAPTGDQVKAILWREINQAHKKGNLIGRTNLTEWYIGGEVVAMGRKPNDYEPTSFQGIHAPEGVLVIYDEACGIPEELFRAGQSMAANDASRELAIGNPDDPGTHFESLFRSGSNWNEVWIDGLATPNLTGEPVTKEASAALINQTYVDDMLADYGEDSPFYIAKVRGMFPKDRGDGIIPFSALQSCRSMTAPDDIEGTVELGIDVGGSSSGDETVVRERIGMVAGRRWGWRYDDPMHSVGDIVAVIKETGATSAKIDAIGVGHGVWGRLREVSETEYLGCEVHAVEVGRAAQNPKDFVNLKAEIWWEIGRNLSRERAWNLGALDDKTIDELAEHRFRRDSSGRIKVESKDEVRARLKRSPDDADALLLSFYEPPVAGPVLLGTA